MSKEVRKENSASIEMKVSERDESVAVLERSFRDKYRKQNEVVQKNFDIPTTEFVLDHYACAHYGKIPKQGRIYITQRFILFFANLLGKKVKKKIPFENVVDIRKDASTFVAVSPIEIHLKFKRFTFISFLKRDRAFEHLLIQWKQNKEGHPEVIKIPLDYADEDEDEEKTGLAAAGEDEPESNLHMETMWGKSSTKVTPKSPKAGGDPDFNSSSSSAGAILSATPTEEEEPKQKRVFVGTNLRNRRKKCCGCFPWKF